MGEQVSFHIKEEDRDLYEWLDENAEVFGGPSGLVVMALKHLRKEKGDEIESLNTKDKSADPV